MEPTEVTVVLRDDPLTPSGVAYVAGRVYDHLNSEAAKGHPLAVFLSEEAVYGFIDQLNAAGKLDVYTFDDIIVGILGYDVATPIWGGNHKVLKELAMFTIDPDFCGFGRIAVERLNELAVEHDCSLIETGDSINFDTTMTKNVYMKKGGFTSSYPCYYKVIVPHIVSI